MRIEIVSDNEQAEKVYIEGCVTAIQQDDLTHTHVLANYRGKEMYFISKNVCTFDTEIAYEEGILEFECILDSEGIKHFHNIMEENSNSIVEIREQFIDYLEAMKEIKVLTLPN